MVVGIRRAVAAIAVALMVLIGGWYWTVAKDGGADRGSGTILPFRPTSHGGGYFVLEFYDPVYSPNAKGYDLPLDVDGLKAIDRVSKALNLSYEQLAFLSQNGIVGIADARHMAIKFFDEYEWLEEGALLPTFVTSDSVLDAYHLLFEKALRDIESERLIEQVRILSQRMMELSDQEAARLPGELGLLAQDNAFFFAVAVRLLDPSAVIPGYVTADVDATVQLIFDADSIARPPRFGHVEDFTQYIPRSHYTSSANLSQYFRAMMWYGRMNFRGDNDEETQRAILASVTLRDDGIARSAYVRMASVLSFIMGAPDDLTPIEYASASDRAFGNLAPGFSGLLDNGKLAGLRKILEAQRPPRILSDVAMPWEQTRGLRLFGQAFVIDSFIFQQCVYNKVADRFMPSGLDVMSALGSEEAWGREPFEMYDAAFQTNLEELRDDIGEWVQDDWSSSLYTAWLYSIQGLQGDTSGDGYPAFMRTPAWDAKQLNAQLGSWTQLTHDTLLYRKQSYTYFSGVTGFTNFTYVEPVPELYSRLGSMVNATLTGLKALGLSTPDVTDKLSKFTLALGSLERVAVAELEGKEASEDDVWAARKAYEITKWETTDGLYPPRVGEFYESKTVVVSDVHTDPNSGRCLEEGVGYVHLMVVAVPTLDGLVACVGPVFAHYEFTQPMDTRLTDEEWRSMLENGTAPEPAPWAQDFFR
jgi:hypothetical protein